MVIAKAKGKAGRVGILSISQNWLGAGSPRIYLEPTALDGQHKVLYETMINYLFSSFTDKHERWWKTALDSNRAKEAYERNSNGLSFKPQIYKSHLEHNFDIIENTTILKLIETHQSSGNSLLVSMQKYLSSNRKEDEDKEIEEQTHLRRTLGQITVKDIEDALRPTLNLPEKDLPDEEEDEEDDMWDRVTTNRKLLEALLYSVYDTSKGKAKRRVDWEAGPGYGDFNRIDIVKTIGLTDPRGFNVKTSKSKRAPPFRIKKQPGKPPVYHLQVILDFGKYFKTILEDSKILYTSTTAFDKDTLKAMKEEVPYSIFGIDNAPEWEKQFLNDDGEINRKYITSDSRSENPPKPPKDFNLTDFLQRNSRVAEIIKGHISPGLWKEIHLQIKCEIGYDEPKKVKDGKTGKVTTIRGANVKPTKFTIEEFVVKTNNKIKVQQWKYQRGGTADEKGQIGPGVSIGASTPIVGGEGFKQSSWGDVANPKLASILHSIRRNHDLLEDMIR
jgi:hypothetical protein